MPTWSEFEILQERFTSLGVPTIVCAPEDLEFDGRELRGLGRKIDLLYRRVLINDITGHPAECEALVARVRGEGRVHGQLVPLQDSRTRRRSSRC